ncbi:hypothetical protein Kpol_2002p38 [Vanderwaltozyma polyspora DSM 70294]|uniref:Ribosomal RNA-processing protein 7 C-terminal domain-containing protein n=1 Tax=Vanderwaltozyma polyspora (strain ATCC 22028 / DSM 70294 / BCRC 21397 / CBS 2163 / NBRC 10782 / NRRL Y-8283 / UCD 57-17) TaxID=436907 RepID=A7TFF4_VANPO|nr:uncharacterized protein Kpol_2002p38 [Vanderwaltozyma polyspora DSM 70294]EDO18968.1 hypothetical protein Kpol_2002p38 [Vanderwaltozyma polyspora DSM 70294]
MPDKNSDPVKVESMKNGFLVMPFKLPTHKAFEKNNKDINSNGYHYTFLKKHESKNEDEQNSVFVVNLPILANIESVKKVVNEICTRYDTVSYVEELLYNDEFGLQEIDLSKLTSDLMSTGSKEESRFTPRNTLLIKFVDDSSCKNFISALKKYTKEVNEKDDKYIEWEYTIPSVATFTNFYKPLDTEYLKEDISNHMELFEVREMQAKEDIQSSIVDEDGFTLVVGKNTKNLNSIRKKILNKNPLLKHGTKIKGPSMVDKKIKEDFYRFQVRERKKQEINQLLSKFKEDQEKIKEMKMKKKFNPYK